MGKNLVDEKKEYIQGPAGKDDSVITTVVAFHPDLFIALSKADNGEARQNLPFVVEGTVIEEGSVVSVSLSEDPNVLKVIQKLREARINGVDR